MACEAEAIQPLPGRLDGSLLRALEIIIGAPGKVVVSGLGKSGLVGQKIAATLCSTGTPAVFSPSIGGRSWRLRGLLAWRRHDPDFQEAAQPRNW